MQAAQMAPYGSLNYATTGGVYDYNGNSVPTYDGDADPFPDEQGLFDQTTGLQCRGLDLAETCWARCRTPSITR